LVYSSPATLAYNSPGAQGFGVKRAALTLPGSVMLLVSPRCCGRNTSGLNGNGPYGDRMYYLLQDETDIVTGRHLYKIADAVQEILSSRKEKPSAVMICITCTDALLGTDMERVCRKCESLTGIPAVPCYMYALTREGRLPPMVSVRKSIYSLLKPAKRRPDAVNLLGFFSPLQEDCELYEILHKAGVKVIRELSRCESFSEYEKMAEANFDLVLFPEARHAALDLEKRLKIPFIELTRSYDTEKIAKQSVLLGQAAGFSVDVSSCRAEAEKEISSFRASFGNISFSVGEWLNADPFELSLSLLRYGFPVKEIFGTLGEANFIYVKKIASLSPETKVYSNLSPTMLLYEEREEDLPDIVVGKDAMYYHNDTPGVPWNSEEQSFGFAGTKKLFRTLGEAMEKGRKKP
ncbi:MAG: oxidoreductase, partial [Lentisphaeria bacterium]|nr:oxidoreductase [Lentisphaeria bacterium]